MFRAGNDNRLSCYLIGSESILTQCAAILLERGHDIRGIVSDAPAIAEWAHSKGIATFGTDGDLAAKLAGEFDYLFSVANLKVLPAKVLERPQRAAINFHDGPLPSYAGLYASNWALLNGEREHEITWHVMHAKVDEGEILIRRPVDISPDETALTLNAKCFTAGIDGFRAMIDGIEAGSLQPLPQEATQKGYFGKWQRPDAAFVLDFARPATELDAIVRASDFGRHDNAFGSAKILHDGKAVRVGRSSPRGLTEASSAGTIVSVDDQEIVVATGAGGIALADFSTTRGVQLTVSAAAELLGVRPGSSLDLLSTDRSSRLTELNSAIARQEPFWLDRLAQIDPLHLPDVRDAGASGIAERRAERLTFSALFASGDTLAAGMVAFLARLADKSVFDIAFRDPGMMQGVSGFEAIAADSAPLHLAIDFDESSAGAIASIEAQLAETRRHRTFLHDLVARSPRLRDRPELTTGSALPVMVEIASPNTSRRMPDGVAVRFVADEQGSSGSIEWDARAMDGGAAVALAAQLSAFLERLPAVTGSIGAVSLLPAADEQHVAAWNDTGASYPRVGVHQLIEQQIQAVPDHIAIRFAATERTYAELGTQANRIAHALRSMGAGRGKRIGICVERGPDMLVAVLGVLKSGAAYVPLDPAFPHERLRYMAEDAEVTAIVSTADLASIFREEGAARLLLDADAALIHTQPSTGLLDDPALSARPEDPAYVIYTSGSTGKPKGVVVNHAGVANFLASMQREPGLSAEDVLLAVTTLSFDIAVLELFLPLMVGGTVVMAAREDTTDGENLAALIRLHGVTVLQATPVTWRMLLAAGWQPVTGFKGLIGGEPLPRDLADSLVSGGVELWNMYGPTETTVWSTCGRVTDPTGTITIGKPVANTTIHILDARQQPRPVGVAGEIYIGGDGVTIGYWNRDELNAERFIADPFGPPGSRLYRTGDQGRWLPDGTIEHLGRLDDQVKLRGFRIELGEIESGIQRHAAIRQVVVMVREDVPGDKRLVAYVVAENATGDLFEELRTLVRETMPEYMVPSQFVLIDHMPMTPNGKRDRKALPVPPTETPRRAAGFVAPRSPTEQKVSDIWAAVLRRHEIGAQDNFFDIGGNSILLMDIVSRIRGLGFEIKPLTMFRFPTIRSLVDHLEGGHVASAGNAAMARAEKQRAAMARQRGMARRA